MDRNSFEVIHALSPQQIHRAGELFREYQLYLDVDLCFQDFDQELAKLPGAYVAPSGALLLAKPTVGPAFGCVALQPDKESGVAELKRLYVQNDHRGSGAGLALTRRALDIAVNAGYSKVRLDTLPILEKAIEMYRRLGFISIEAYRFNPIPGTMYFELDLTAYRQRGLSNPSEDATGV